MQDQSAGTPPLIAIIGSDGSGKSTVSAHVLDWVSQHGPAAMVHLGKQSGNVGRTLARLPLVGTIIGQVLQRRTRSERARIDASKPPSLLAALVISAFVLRRRLRFQRMLALREDRFIVIADRFPQLAIPDAYDGPQFPVSMRSKGLVSWMAKRELATFQWMTSHKPDLVLRLNVDLDTACARKPDHSREALRKKISVTPLLTYNGAPIIDIDTSQPLADVLRESLAAVKQVLPMAKYGCESKPSRW